MDAPPDDDGKSGAPAGSRFPPSRPATDGERVRLRGSAALPLVLAVVAASVAAGLAAEVLLPRHAHHPEDPHAALFYPRRVPDANGFLPERLVARLAGRRIPEAPEITRETIASMAEGARRWLIADVRRDGTFHYRYDPTRDRYAASNNPIRQWMAVRTLAALAERDPTLLPLHRRNLEGTLAWSYREQDGHGRIEYRGSVKLGAVAVAVRALAASPFYPEYATRATALAATIRACQNSDGGFRPYFVEPSKPYDAVRLLYFYSGEALLALVELYERSGDPELLAAARRGAAFYLDEYVTQIDAHYYPAYVPWHTLALNKLRRHDPDSRYAAAIFTLNDRLITMQNDTAEPQREFLGRFYDPRTPQYGTPHSSSDGVYVDGLVYAYALARELGDRVRVRRYGRALHLGLLNLARLQYSDVEASRFVRPERLAGAIRIHTAEPDIRVDTTQHTLDGLLQLQEVLAAGP